jgi:hypothetical protein
MDPDGVGSKARTALTLDRTGVALLKAPQALNEAVRFAACRDLASRTRSGRHAYFESDA